MLPKAIEIALLIALPLGWGLAVDCVFEWIHRRRARRHAVSGTRRP